MSALTDFYLSANRQLPLRWVSGTSYGIDADVWSAVDGRMYRRIVAGAGTTDPSSDATNWKPIIAGGVKVQRGTSSMTGGTAAAVTAAITAVASTAKCQLRIVSVVTNAGAGNLDFSTQVAISFDSVSQIRMTRLTTTNPVDVQWEVTEFLG